MDTTLFTLPDFLSPPECAELVALAERRGFEPAPITTSAGFVMMPDVRNNTRVMVDDFEHARALWERLRPHIGARAGWEPVGLNERLRFYRYDPSQAFRWHYDGRYRRSATEESALTFMIYLNDDFTGGETEIERATWTRHRCDVESVVPRTGMALVFAHRLRHQGAPVEQGRKYVLRSDVMFRRVDARGEAV